MGVGEYLGHCVRPAVTRHQFVLDVTQLGWDKAACRKPNLVTNAVFDRCVFRLVSQYIPISRDVQLIAGGLPRSHVRSLCARDSFLNGRSTGFRDRAPPKARLVPEQHLRRACTPDWR